jgi:hypothetical protein
MAAQSESGIQQGIATSKIDYYDMMVIGRTGMGKSTTVDKLLVANPKNHQEAQHADPEVEPSGERMRADNLTMWLISGDVEAAQNRLKNMIFCRSVSPSHVEINETHARSSPATDKCELLSNETTKLRILDVPGFFGKDAGKPTNRSRPAQSPTLASAQSIVYTDLGIMRNILQIQAAMCMKFKRIVYFLPEKGPLVRPSGDLQLELSTMIHYFGESIFDCMVLAATVSATLYKKFREDAEIFEEDDFQNTEKYFQEALRQVLPNRERVPKPPIVFVSMHDSCEAIFDKIDRAAVVKPVVELAFQSQICARCGTTTKIVRGEKIACYYGPDPDQSIPYEQSTCHPLFVPKYSKFVKILGGIAHVLTFRAFAGNWPGFTNMDEICINCRQSPGTQGCHQIKKKYLFKSESLPVDHKNDTNEPVVMVSAGAESEVQYHEIVIDMEQPPAKKLDGADIEQ